MCSYLQEYCSLGLEYVVLFREFYYITCLEWNSVPRWRRFRVWRVGGGGCVGCGFILGVWHRDSLRHHSLLLPCISFLWVTALLHRRVCICVHAFIQHILNPLCFTLCSLVIYFNNMRVFKSLIAFCIRHWQAFVIVFFLIFFKPHIVAFSPLLSHIFICIWLFLVFLCSRLQFRSYCILAPSLPGLYF